MCVEIVAHGNEANIVDVGDGETSTGCVKPTGKRTTDSARGTGYDHVGVGGKLHALPIVDGTRSADFKSSLVVSRVAANVWVMSLQVGGGAKCTSC